MPSKYFQGIGIPPSHFSGTDPVRKLFETTVLCSEEHAPCVAMLEYTARVVVVQLLRGRGRGRGRGRDRAAPHL